MASDTVRVVFCIDDAYALPTSVAVMSMLETTKRDVEFYFVDGGLSASSRDRLSTICRGHATFVSPRAALTDLSPSHLSGYWSPVILARLDLPRVLRGLARVLSLDGDILVLDDIGELWDQGMAETTPLRMALSSLAPYGYPGLRAAGFDASSLHFNSGVIDMNLDVLDRRISEASRVLEANPQILFPEMDALNVAFQGEIERIESRWHVQLHSYYHMFGVAGAPACLAGIIDADEARRAIEDPALVHFLERWKPWHLDADARHSQFATRWRELARMTPWASELEAFSQAATLRRTRKELAELYALHGRDALVRLIQQDAGEA